MTAAEACHAAAVAIRRIYPNAEIVCVPLSDGGEGLVECISNILPTQMVHFKAHGPLMEPIEATYAVSADGQTAYMEMAATSGLPMVSIEKRDPTRTTTYGVGEMIINAVNRGCNQIVMGLGGSATCDGGRGMLEAIADARCPLPLANDACASWMKEIMGTKYIEPANCTQSRRLQFSVVSDVTNPLYGPNGAAYTFSIQKGATPEQVVLLDKQLRDFARQTEKAGIASPEAADWPGAGAAGGLGYGLMTYLGAQMQSGIDTMLNTVRFDEQISGADLVITGEGKSDFQTLMGKVPNGVLRRCRAQGIAVWLLSGMIDDEDHTLAKSFDRIGSINEGDMRPLSTLMQLEVAQANMIKTLQSMFP